MGLLAEPCMQTPGPLAGEGSSSLWRRREEEGDGTPTPSQCRGDPTGGATRSLVLDFRPWQRCRYKEPGSGVASLAEI